VKTNRGWCEGCAGYYGLLGQIGTFVVIQCNSGHLIGGGLEREVPDSQRKGIASVKGNLRCKGDDYLRRRKEGSAFWGVNSLGPAQNG